jgi:hypothetical protein
MDNDELERLKKKFLGTNNEDSRVVKDLKTAIATDLPGWKISDESIDELNYSGNELRVVKVQPKNGGPSKVADYRNGKIQIVQG